MMVFLSQNTIETPKLSAPAAGFFLLKGNNVENFPQMIENKEGELGRQDGGHGDPTNVTQSIKLRSTAVG